jgi:hypothetical protein
MNLEKTISMFHEKTKSSKVLKNDPKYSKLENSEMTVMKMSEFKRKTLGLCGQSTVKPFYELDGILTGMGLSSSTEKSLEILDSFEGSGIPRGIDGYLGVSKLAQTNNFYTIGLYARNGGQR